jgi:cytochrome c-type biogenesis protein CcmE
MQHRHIKIAATTVVLVLAFAGLLWSTLRDGAEYFKNVNEVTTNRPAWEGKPMQIHGYVVRGSLLNKPDTLEWRFKIQNNPARATEPGDAVDAWYTGVVPDTFKEEAEVVLKGRLASDGFHTVPNGVVAKCPSKYEAASGPGAGSGS